MRNAVGSPPVRAGQVRPRRMLDQDSGSTLVTELAGKHERRELRVLSFPDGGVDGVLLLPSSQSG